MSHGGMTSNQARILQKKFGDRKITASLPKRSDDSWYQDACRDLHTASMADAVTMSHILLSRSGCEEQGRVTLVAVKHRETKGSFPIHIHEFNP